MSKYFFLLKGYRATFLVGAVSLSYQLGDVRIILPINEEGLKKIESNYFMWMFHATPNDQVDIKKTQPNIIGLLMEVFNTT